MMNIDRRTFLRATGATTASLLATNSALCLSPRTAGIPQTICVNLRGGVDGHSLIIPHGASDYTTRRSRTLYQPNEYTVLKQGAQDTSFALPNQLVQSLLPAWEAGNMAVIHHVGFPSPNLSHFTSQDRWASMQEGKSSAGWLGRLSTAQNWAASSVVGIQSSYLVEFRGDSGDVVPTPLILDRVSDFASPENNKLTDLENMRRNAALTALNNKVSSANAVVSANRANALSADQFSAVVAEAYATYSGSGNYGLPPLELFPGNMREIAGLVAGSNYDPQFRPNVFYTLGVGGFDTHSDQRAALDSLLPQFDDGLRGILKDIGAHGSAVSPDSSQLVVLYTEFGRRLDDNASDGTDHGLGNVMILIGNRVNGGHYGIDPFLNGPMPSTLDNENTPVDIDPRQVFLRVIRDYMGIADSVTLDKVFPEGFGSMTSDLDGLFV